MIVLDIHTQLQAPFRIALTQLDHADLYLARRGDDDLTRARHLTTSAVAAAAEFGFADSPNERQPSSPTSGPGSSACRPRCPPRRDGRHWHRGARQL